MARRAHDPFDPERRGVQCPSCSGSVLVCSEDTVRACQRCGRVERWSRPSRVSHGARRFERLLSRQRKKFGDLDLILFQWIAEPEPRREK